MKFFIQRILFLNVFDRLNGAYNTTGIKNMCMDSKIDFLS